MFGYLDRHGLGFSSGISVGNEANLDIVDCMSHLAACPHTRVIGLYIESIRRGREFIDVARTIVPHKPIVAFYVGGSEAGKRAGLSHTGALAGPDALYDGVFRQSGVIRAHSIPELFDYCWVLGTCPRPGGNRVIVQPGAVIGADGFGFAPNGQSYYKIPQVGHVVIEDDVEIGACSCIDRGTLGVTRLARGVKIDNLVQVAHNVQVGEDTLLVAQTGIAGSTVIGKHCVFGGQTATAGHIKIGDNVTLAARGGIANNVDGNQSLAGAPSMPHREWLKATMTMPHLPEMRRELNRLKKQVDELKSKLSEDED